jgi:DNA polymerase III subunit epsilon
VKPRDIARLNNTVDIHGITPEMVEFAPTFPDVYQSIHKFLNGAPWIVYNASFDPHVLEQNCLMHGLAPIVNIGINDAMQMVAEYFGDWDKVYQRFKNKKLTEAAEALGIMVSNAHNALADAETTYKVVQALAQS